MAWSCSFCRPASERDRGGVAPDDTNPYFGTRITSGLEEIRQSCLRTCIKSGGCSRSYTRRCTYGIAPARRWILYGPSEQSRWAPQLGQRSWHACMSIIACPHMGHSFLLPAAIHHAPGSAPYYSCQHARCLRQRLPCLCAYLRQSCRMRGSPVKCGQSVPGPHRASRTWPRCVPEPNGPIPGPIWLHGSGRSPGASGIPATDALSPQLALKAPLCLPVQPVCMVAVP